MVGQTISHYHILEKLGEGGMGVVYKAQDLKLDRLVALKFLPHNVQAREEEQARFLQEAKSAALLNHPNVCTIFDINEENGQQFIVMEYVEGKTLRRKIEDGGLIIEDCIQYAIQIGDALQEAHSHGIVHRDVKAENIMVNARNQIKVMDFGLAKLKGSLKLTRTTSTVGTLAYMAPEQIQGGDADARSDIFSFGVVLYEMLTGHTPFHGEHEAAIMYSILNEEPDSPLKFRPQLPPEATHILTSALEKDPQDRYQSAAEMVRELRRLQKQSARVSRKPLEGMPMATGTMHAQSVSLPHLGPAQAAHEETPMVPKKGVPLWVKLVAGLALLVILILVYWQFTKPSYEISKDMVFRPLNIPFSTIWYPGLSADGNWIAFPATDDMDNSEIYYMNSSGGEPKRLTFDSLFKYTAAISPDGSQVVYSRGVSRQMPAPTSRSLWIVSTLGGEPKKIVDNGFDAKFSLDGKKIAYNADNPDKSRSLCMVNVDGSNIQLLFTEAPFGGGRRVSWAWSPDGRAVAFIRNFVTTEGPVQEVVTRDLQSGREQQLTHDQKNIDEVCWAVGGLILFSSNRGGTTNLWAVPASGGTPFQITRGPGPDIAVRVSANGKRVLYLQQAQFGAIQIGAADGSNCREITPADQFVQYVKLSPDGKRVAYVARDPDPIKRGFSIYLMNRNGQNRNRIFQANTVMLSILWSPDGRKIAFSARDTIEHTGVIDVDAPGRASDIGPGLAQGWLDGSSALNILRNLGSWRVPLDGSAPVKISQDSTAILFSPDHRSQLLIDKRSMKNEVFIQESGGTQRHLLEGSFERISWIADGKDIVLEKRDGSIWLVSPKTGQERPYVWKDPVTLGPSDITQDRKASVSIRHKMQSKLIIIDNFMQ